MHLHVSKLLLILLFEKSIRKMTCRTRMSVPTNISFGFVYYQFSSAFFFFFINHSILGQNGIMLCSVHVFLSYQKGLTHRTKWTFLKYWICFCGSSENQTKCARNSWCIETYKPQFQSNAEIKNLIMFSAKNDLNFKFQFKPMFNLKR